MHRLVGAALAAAVLLLWPHPLVAEDRALTLDQMIELARARAPALLSARARIDEARGRLVSASALLRDNPVVEGGGGARTSDRGDFVEMDVGLEQTFELGGRRGARIDAAQAAIHRAEAVSHDTVRRLLRDVAVAFYSAVYAQERVRLATSAETVASELLRVAERRRAVGDAPTLEVNVARASLARARADLHSAEATRAAALGELRLLLGFGTDDTLTVAGDLRDRRRFDPDALIARALRRADLRALSAEIREAEADRRLGNGLAWPDLGVGARYEREEDADVVLGTLSLTLPIFEHGAGARAEAEARARRLRLDLDVGRRTIDVEVRVAFDAFRLRTAAVEEFEHDALALLDENESMARRAYEAGAMGLGELLAVRRELLDMRRGHLDRLLEAAVAGIDLQTVAGALE